MDHLGREGLDSDMEPSRFDVESEWEIVLSTLQEMFGDIAPSSESSLLCGGDQEKSPEEPASAEPRETDPPATTASQTSRADVAQPDGCSVSVVRMEHGCYQNYVPPSVRYAPATLPLDYGYQVQHLNNFWPTLESINSAAQSYLGVNGKRVIQVITPTPFPGSPLATNFKPRQSQPVAEKPGPYVRRPPNAFMIFMRENRAHVTATLKPKHSVEANSILGQMWKSMTSEQQDKYYKLAAEERRRHAELHPDWSSKDNYGRKVKRRRTKAKME